MADENVSAGGETTAAAEPATPAVPSKPESLSEQMARLGWEKDAKHDAVPNSLGAKARAKAAGDEPEPSDEPTKPDVPKPKLPEPKPEPAADDTLAEDLEQLKALVAKLGMQMDDSRVTVAERAALREERRQAREALAQTEREMMARVEAAAKAEEERRQKDAPRFDKLSSFEKAIEEGDHEAMAKLAGFESYDKLQEHIIALKADPAYKRLRAVEERAERIERETREREEAARKAAEEETARQTAAQQQREQAETRAAYIKSLQERMSTSEDPVVKAMHDDGAFVGAMFRVMQEHYQETGEELAPEKAIRKAARGAAQPLYAELKRLYDKIQPIFGAPAAVKTDEKPAPKKPRSPEPVGKPSPSAKKLDDREWKQQAARRLEEAVALERRSNGAAR